MDCNLSLRLLNSSLDNELDEGKKFKVQKHLNKCSHCQKEYEKLLKLKSTLSNLKQINPSENFEANLMSKIKELPEKKSKWFKLPELNFSLDFPKLSFAVGCIGLAFGLYFAAMFVTEQNQNSTVVASNDKSTNVEKIYQGVVPPTSAGKGKHSYAEENTKAVSTTVSKDNDKAMVLGEIAHRYLQDLKLNRINNIPEGYTDKVEQFVLDEHLLWAEYFKKSGNNELANHYSRLVIQIDENSKQAKIAKNIINN